MLNVIKNKKKSNACEALTDNKFKKKMKIKVDVRLQRCGSQGSQGK